MARLKQSVRAAEVFERLRSAHPEARCELEHRSPFELLVSVVLSAQATDVSVNKLTPGLFARYPDARTLARAEPRELEKAIQSIGMFRQKAKHIQALSRELVARHGGEVPRSMAELVVLPGVGRKTANVVLGVAFGAPAGVVVDTHVLRVSQRLGLTRDTTAEGAEADLNALFPAGDWELLGHTLIFHGRRICTARHPACGGCPVSDLCPNAFRAEQVGRKAPRGAGSSRAETLSRAAKVGRSKVSRARPGGAKTRG